MQTEIWSSLLCGQEGREKESLVTVVQLLWLKGRKKAGFVGKDSISYLTNLY